MRNILALIGAAVVAFLGAGWYMGWYEISRKQTPDGGTLQLNINTDKTREGIGEIGEKAKKVVNNILDRKDAPPPLTTPSGPASNFFMPGKTDPKQNTGGWKPIGSDNRNDDGGFFGINLPKK